MTGCGPALHALVRCIFLTPPLSPPPTRGHDDSQSEHLGKISGEKSLDQTPHSSDSESAKFELSEEYDLILLSQVGEVWGDL